MMYARAGFIDIGLVREGKHFLQRLFSTFPAGRPAIGLLILRLVVGLTLVFQSAVYFNNWHTVKLDTAVVLALMCLGGLGVLAGALTPLASFLVVLCAMGYALSWIPAPTPNLLESKLLLANLVAMAAAILFLGPGAFSVDARLFGRREILIPHARARRNRNLGNKELF